jgi:hypothetical protein
METNVMTFPGLPCIRPRHRTLMAQSALGQQGLSAADASSIKM